MQMSGQGVSYLQAKNMVVLGERQYNRMGLGERMLLRMGAHGCEELGLPTRNKMGLGCFRAVVTACLSAPPCGRPSQPLLSPSRSWLYFSAPISGIALLMVITFTPMHWAHSSGSSSN
jgi:hypothetical protein